MTVRWGVLGTGGIAAAMVAAIRAEGGEVVAVASADPGRAAAFARAYGIAHHHTPHRALLGAHDLDVVYVATTNDRHAEDAMVGVDAGVAVLVEKPFTLDLASTEAVLTRAETAGVLVVEAMWMRMQPAFLALEQRLAAGDIGPPSLVTASFGVVLPTDPDRRWYAPTLGGGSLLDLGVYPLTLAVSVLGPPVAALAVGDRAATGVDTQVAAALRHEHGVSSWACSFVADSLVEATVAGPEGSLRLHAPFHSAPRLTRWRGGQQVGEHAAVGWELGLRHEVREVHRCLATGARESPRMPWELTRTVMRWLDELHRQLGDAPG